MRSLGALLAASLLVACGAPPATRGSSQAQKGPADVPVEFLMASAVADFKAHRPPYPARVRDVRIGYAMTPERTRQYLMCGAFLPVREGGEPEWTAFATIKTSGFEQWLGGQAAGFCGHSSIVWVDGDFTSSLQSRLESSK